MKSSKCLLSLACVLAFVFCMSNSFAQNNCRDENGNVKKGGIALTRDDENGNHNTPTAALSYPKFKGGNKAMYRYIYKNQQYPHVYAMAGFEIDIKQFTITLGDRYGFLNLDKRNTGTTTKVYGFFINFGHTF